MAGVTLSVEEIRAAPIEVRRWLEHEVLRAFGVAPEPAAQPAVTLVGCNIDEVRDMLALVQDKLPVVSVFFELGREATSSAAHGMRAFRVADILSHTRLHTPDQVIECLAALTRALRQVRGDADAVFHVMDNQGHCLVAETTMRSILKLWQEIVAQRALQGEIAQPNDLAVA
ncbi:MAG TPA: hypothetical protein VHT74_29090 [Acetobacteraceae bacterium]|jgi:hypothetical protein|nr:hypothetical protein [Acetobacteraceae bacterium]